MTKVKWTCQCGREVVFHQPMPKAGFFECLECNNDTFWFRPFYLENQQLNIFVEDEDGCEDCDDKALGILR